MTTPSSQPAGAGETNDQEINAEVAEVAGWRYATDEPIFNKVYSPTAVPPVGICCGKGVSKLEAFSYNPEGDLPREFLPPDYLHDANAVIALLEKHLWECWVHENGDYSVRLSQTSPITRTKGFCRAACVALLKAHGHDCGKEGV